MPSVIDWECPWGLVSDAHGNPLGLQITIRSLRQRGARTLFWGLSVDVCPGRPM